MAADRIQVVAFLIYCYLLMMESSIVVTRRPKKCHETFRYRSKNILQCNFDKGVCPSLELVPEADFDWEIGTGPTLSENTGPANDHTSKKGSYIYIDSGNVKRLNREFARFRTTWLHVSYRKCLCFTFWYHMKGLTTGTLSVYFQEENNEEVLWFSRSGEQGNFWMRTVIPFTASKNKFRIIFQAKTSYGHTSDIAIDDISLDKGPSRCHRWPPNQVEKRMPRIQPPAKLERPENTESCGKRKVRPGNNRRYIVEGKDSYPGEWPWMAMLTKLGYDSKSYPPVCGGTLLGDRWIVTAAHCVFDMETRDEIHIRLGVTSASDDPEHGGSEVDVKIAEVFVHPDYNYKIMLDNDVALLKLTAPVQFNTFINSVCLPSEGAEVEVGKSCYVTGWGRMGNKGVPQSTILQKGRVTVQSNRKCNKVYKNHVTRSMMCAGNDEGVISDTCDGDSGGPLLHENDSGQWELAGITSWGAPNLCGAAGKYGVYTNVMSSDIRDWILKITSLESNDDRIKFRDDSDLR